jgi:hypothetical protein
MRFFKFLFITALLLALLLAAALGAAAWWLSGDGLREQVRSQLEQRVGVPVKLAGLSFALNPAPAIAATGLELATTPPLSAQRITVRPAWQALLGLGQPRSLVLHSLDVEGLKLSQRGVEQLQHSLASKTNIARKTLQKSEQTSEQIQRSPAKNASAGETQAGSAAWIAVGALAVPQTTRIQGMSWQTTSGEVMALSATVRMSEQRDSAQIHAQLGGGTLSGQLRWQGLEPGARAVQLRGELNAQGVDLAALPGLKTKLTGRLTAQTRLDAQAAQPAQSAQIAASLQTSTDFNIAGAVLQGIDLAKAVRTLGLSRGGQTPLEQLSGKISTRGVGAGLTAQLSGLDARSKLLKASGEVSVGSAFGAGVGSARALSGKVTVDLNAGGSLGKVGELVGIPLIVSGNTAAPELRPSTGALIGGTLGSMAAPVIGTGAGAKLGDKVGGALSGLKDRLFGK